MRERGFALLAVVTFLALMAFATLLLREQSAQMSSATRAASEPLQMDYLLESAYQHAQWHLSKTGCSAYSDLASQRLGDHRFAYTFGTNSGSPVDISLQANLQNGLLKTASRASTPSYGSSTITVIDATDTVYIEEDKPDHNHHNDGDLRIQSEAGEVWHGLVYVPITSLPTQAKITRAQLELSVKDAVATPLLIERITEDSTADEVTWETRRDGSILGFPLHPWDTQGGTTSGVTYAEFVPSFGNHEIDITNLVQEWHAGSENYGMLLKLASPNIPQVRINAWDSGVAEIKLRVWHTCECGQTCAVDNAVTCDANIRPNTQRRSIATSANPHQGMTHITENSTTLGITAPADGAYLAADASVIYAYDSAGTSLGSCDLSLADDITGLTTFTNGANAGRIGVVTNKGNPDLYLVGETCAVAETIDLPNTINTPTGVAALTYNTANTYQNHFAVLANNGTVQLLDESYALVTTITPSPAPVDAVGIAHVPNQDLLLILDNDSQEVFKIDFTGAVLGRYDYTRFTSTSPGGLAVNLASCDHILAADTQQVSEIYQEPLSATAVAHWSFNDGTGSTVTDGIGGFNGTSTTALTWSTDGPVQGAATLSSNTITVPHDDGLNATDTVSAAGWIKPTGTGTPAHVLLSKGASTNQNYWFGIRNNQFAVVYNDGSYTLVEAPGTLAQDTWHHLAYTYAANANLNMYVNGSLVHTEAAGGTLSENTTDALLGTSSSGGFVLGEIDDVYLFDAELSATDIQLLYNESPLSGGSGPGAAAAPSCTTENYADNFDAVSYANNDGSVNWTSQWTEIGESTDPNAGDNRVRTSAGVQHLRVRDNDNGGEGVIRSFDLTNFSSATLTFNYARLNLSGGEYVTVSIVQGGTETELARYENGNEDANAMLTETLSLDSYLGDTAELKFLTDPSIGNDSGLMIDNVNISGCSP